MDESLPSNVRKVIFSPAQIHTHLGTVKKNPLNQFFYTHPVKEKRVFPPTNSVCRIGAFSVDTNMPALLA